MEKKAETKRGVGGTTKVGLRMLEHVVKKGRTGRGTTSMSPHRLEPFRPTLIPRAAAAPTLNMFPHLWGFGLDVCSQVKGSGYSCLPHHGSMIL